MIACDGERGLVDAVWNDGSIVRRDLYARDETYEACFEHVSQVLTPSSANAELEFIDPQHGTFRSAWRLAK